MCQTIGGSTENRHSADKVPWNSVQAGVILSDFFYGTGLKYVGHTKSNEQQFLYKLKFIVM